MKNSRIILSLVAVLLSTAAWALVGPQSLKVTFNTSGDSEGWSIAEQTGSGKTTGTMTVSDGYANVTMGVQDSGNKKYRADLSFTSETFTFDKTKDLIWAVKLRDAIPGSGTSKKLRLHYENNAGGFTEGGQINTSTLDCADGGKIYYADISSYGDIKEDDAHIKYATFIFADAVIDDAEDAHYSVDWIATFTSEDELKFYRDWKDEQTDFSEPVFEILYRPGNDGFPKSGVNTNEFEGNYVAKIFAVQYYLIEDFSTEKVYTLELTNTQAANKEDLSVWNFNHVVSAYTSNDDISTKATGTVGVAPGSETGDINVSIDDASVSSSKWKLIIPAANLIPIATVDGKTLVGLLITNKAATTKDNKAKFASTFHTTVAHPTLVCKAAKIGSTYYDTFNEALDAVADGNTIEIHKNVSTNKQVRKDNISITIDGKNHTLTTTHTMNAPFLTSTGNITLKNITIDGNSSSIAKNLIESGNTGTFTLQNVTIQNAKSSENSGVVCTKGNNGNQLILDNVTFKNCENTGDKNAILLLGNNNCVAKNTLTFIDCIGNEIFVEGNNRLEVDGTFASDVIFTLASNRAESKAIAKGNGTTLTVADLSKFSEDSNSWDFYFDNNEIKARHYTALALNDDADNASALETASGTKCNVTLTRSIPSASFSTFCLPFDVSAEDVATKFNDPELLEYKNTIINGEEATFHFVDATDGIKAGVPYLIKPSSDISDPIVFYGVTVDNTTREVSDGNFEFVPLFSKTTTLNSEGASHKYIYLGASDQLYWAAQNTTIKGFRAYLEDVRSGASYAPIRRFAIGRNNTPTDIENVQSDKVQCTKVLRDGQVIILRDGVEYNLMGQKIK